MITKNVVAALIIKDNKIFVTQRGYGEFKGFWEFPGGKIEEGETKEEALIREIKEELDTTIKVANLVKEIDYDYPTFHLHMSLFLSEIIEGNLTLLEAEDSKWISKDEIKNLNWLPADYLVLNDLFELLNQ